MEQCAIIAMKKKIQFGSMCDTIYSENMRILFLTKLTSQQFGGNVDGVVGVAHLVNVLCCFASNEQCKMIQ